MAISSRLALWEQKIREEDRVPPPTSPPPLFSAIPGGFIKQLVRETEKEAKAKEKVIDPPPPNAKENPPGQPVEGPAQPFVIKDPNILEVGMAGKGPGQLLQGRLNGEKPPHGGEGLSEMPEKKLPPFKRAVPRASPKSQPAGVSSAPEPGPPTAPKLGETLASDSPPKAPAAPEQNKSVSPKDHHPGSGTEPARKGHVPPWHKRFESPGKENVKVGPKEDPPGRLGSRARGAAKGRELGENKERLGESGKPAGEARRKLGEAGKGSGEPKEKAGKAGKDQAPSGHKAGKEMVEGAMGEKVGETGKGLGRRGAKEEMGKETGKGPLEAQKKKGGEAEEEARRGGEASKGPTSPKEEGGPGKEGLAGVPEGGGGTQGPPDSGAAAEAQEKAQEATQEGAPRGSKEDPPGQEESIAPDKVCADVWYETEKVWLVQKEGFTLATQLKPDFGTPELPAGKVRVRLEADGSVLEVEEENIQRANSSRFDVAEDLASLPSLNESSLLHTLRQRFQSQLVYTYSGSDLVALEPHSCLTKGLKKAQVFKGKRDGVSPPLPPHIFSVAQKAYWNMLMQRKDQALVPLGRSGAGKTTCCQEALEYLVAMAGSVGKQVTVEKIQAAFTLLQAFGSVATAQNEASTRFSLALALDFSASGRITAAHLQTMLLERSRVAQQPEGESSFNVFAQMLAGLDLDQRTLLHLHQMAEDHSFGLRPFAKAEEKRKASAAFAQLRSAMATLGIAPGEQEAVWRVLAGIYHLGAAGACKVGRKQFAKFEWATNAAEALGCDFEDLATAVFKHHLRRIMAQATAGPGGQLGPEDDPFEGPKLTGQECVEGMAAGLYEELFATLVSLINRSFSSSHLSVASILVLDTPGFHNPRHQRTERAATFEEFCHNYAHERLQGLFYERTFLAALERYREEKVEVAFDLPDLSPDVLLPIVDQNASKPHGSQGGDQAEEPKGLFWILDEEALVQGSGDSAALHRLCSYFVKEGTLPGEDPGRLRMCEQALHFEMAHRLGQDPVRYDATGWVAKAKWNLSAQNAPQVLSQSKADPLKKLFLPRAKTPLTVRPVAGLEGAVSQPALQRIGCVRKTFSSAFAAVKRRSVCAQIKLQLDALLNLVKRSQIHFVHCLVPRAEAGQGEEGSAAEAVAGLPSWDIPSLRAQISGAHILDALRLYRIGYADRMGLTQFRHRFQVLAQPVMKKYTSAYETADEAKALEELFQALNLEKKTLAVGRTQVFLKAGVLARLEKQRERLVAQSLVSLQAACKGFLSRQRYRKLKIQFLAARCIQRNLAIFQSVKTWSWWRLLCAIRPLLTISIAEGQLQAREEEIATLRKKLENSELSRQELRQSTELLETKVLDLTMDLSDECLKGDVACQVLEGERAERLRGTREIRELQSKHDQLQKKLESVERQLEETQQQLELREFGATSPRKDGEWQMRLECAQTEIGFLRKRIVQLEERLESEQKSKKELEEKLSEAQKAFEGARRSLQQLRRKSKQLTCDLEDTRVLAESQQSRNHELEKRQKKFDLQLAQALGESAFERSRREKVAQENSGLQFQVEKLQRALEQKESEHASLVQRAELLSARLQESSSSGSPEAKGEAALRKELWDLEATVAEQRKELSAQTGTLEQMEQLHLRLELEIERTKQLHQKELEDKEEELEDVRQSCQKRLRQLEGQWEGSCEEKQALRREKKDLEGLVALLCEQIGHRDFDVEKCLRRDLRRTRALLADMQLLLEEASAPGSGPSGAKEELEKLRGQLEESQAQQSESQKSQKMLVLEVENLRTELEGISRNKTLMDEQLYLLQHEKADLLRRVDEDQEDLNELMAKHKALIAQSAMDIAQIRELQTQLEEMQKQKQSLQEKLQAAHAQVAYLEQAMVARSIVSRQEALICDLENKMAFQSVQIKRFEMLVLRLRDSVLQMGEDLGKAREGEAREKENGRYYQMRMEEMKAEMKELAERELEAQRRRVELEKQVEELSAVRQTLQADLETSIRRIADLQVVLEEVQSSDESDTESLQTAQESLSSRLETESQLSLPSTMSLNLVPEGSLASWLGPPSGWTSPSSPGLARSPSWQSLNSQSTSSGIRMHKDPEVVVTPQPESPLGAKRKVYGRNPAESEGGLVGSSPSFVARRRESGRPLGTEEAGAVASPSMIQRLSSPTVAEGKLPSLVSPSMARRISPAAEEKLLHSSSSSALSEYVEELRRNRLKEKDPGKLAVEEASVLPIYQTTGASSLRRCRTLKESQDLPFHLEDLGGSAGLIRSSSLRSASSDNAARPLPSPALKRVPQFGSYDSLVQNMNDPCPKVGSPVTVMGDTLGPPQPKPWRSYLETSLEEATEEAGLGREPLVFQSKRFGDAGQGRDPFSWKIPAMSYERKATTSPEVDYFPPAIRKAHSTSSLSRGSREKPMSVRFEDEEVPPKRTTFLSEIKTVLSPPPRAKEEDDDPGRLSDSSDSSSGSQVSFQSTDSIKRRPKAQRPQGEGGGGVGQWACGGGGEGARNTHRSEAEGKEDDVNSIMMRYLGKE